MSHPLDRRRFLASTAALGVALSADAHPSPGRAEREFYELRRYKLDSPEQRELLLAHLQDALLPALGRAGLAPIGVFAAAEDGEDHDVHMLLPFKNLATLETLDESLAADSVYTKAAAAWFARTEPVYTRLESRLLQAFHSIPVLELPAQTASRAPRLFELRTYESVNADAARRKVTMFDEGETQLMRDVGLAPVFFGATRIGHDVPNLTYMLSAEDDSSHQAHWQAFLAHPEWTRMKADPRFAGTVSKITKTFLRPVDFSQI
jgi:hypothetical protein